LGEVVTRAGNERLEEERKRKTGDNGERRSLLLDFGYASPLSCLVAFRKRRDVGIFSPPVFMIFLERVSLYFGRIGYCYAAMFQYFFFSFWN